MFEDKIVLITGGTGSWANELVKQLLGFNPKQIRLYSRGELSQVNMKRKFNNPKLKFIIGDVRDLDQLVDAFKGVDIVFHLAALKHVPVCEEYPYEAIKTNIGGTRNVIKAAIINNVSKVIDVSSDKAVSPLNLYGMTKAVGEKLFLHADRNSNTKFVCIRGGNALGSNGSVVPLFINQIKKNNKITITHPQMTRYFLSLSEAIKLLFIACESGIPNALFVMKMPSCTILGLALALREKYGNKNTKIEEIGVRPGEKIHEELVAECEAPNTYEYNKDYYVVTPEKLNLPKVTFNKYTSDSQPLMSDKQILKLLKKGNF